MVWGASVTTRAHIWCFCRVKNPGARYISQVVNPVFFGRKVMCFFQQINARPHTAAELQRALRGVQQLLWPGRSPDLSQIVDVWDTMKRELFSQNLPQPLQNWDNRCTMLGTIHRRMTFGTCENTRLHYRRRRYTVYWCDCLGTPYCDVCLI